MPPPPSPHPPFREGMRRRFWRSTAVRLLLLYMLVFFVATGILGIYIGRTATDIITRDLRETVEKEADDLQQLYEDNGLRAVLVSVEQRARLPGAGVYLVVDLSGNIVGGNVTEAPGIVFGEPPEKAVRIRYDRVERTGGQKPKREVHQAIARVLKLEEGFRVLVGQDLGEQGSLRNTFARAYRALFFTMLALGIVTWWFVSRRVLKRIDQVSRTGNRIVAGDLSGRLEVTGSGDEFDRLAVGVNAMLGRIETLMKGLKDVSDNIAHDLKTPLTRMRNRLDAALTGPEEATRYREAIEATIEESDGLIRTFDALLMIARVEAGNQPVPREPLDLAAVARDVAELYEPLAEDQGGRLTVNAPAPVPVSANRELISLALSNLIDNALKYGRVDNRPLAVTVTVASEAGHAVVCVADNGPGIAEADRGRVLDRFVRLEKSRNAPGSGLGLSLVVAIARAHGGTVTLEDAGPGLRVRVDLNKMGSE